MSKTKVQTKAPEPAERQPVVQKQPETAERAGGPSPAAQMTTSALPPPNGKPSAARAADLMRMPVQRGGVPGRARMSSAVQRSVGNARLSRMLGAPVQTKLTVGAPDDVYEQEADQVADRVTHMPQPPGTNEDQISRPASPAVRRQSTDEEAPGSSQGMIAQRQMAGEDEVSPSSQSIQRQIAEDEAPEPDHTPALQRQRDEDETTATQEPMVQPQYDDEEHPTDAILPRAQRQMAEADEPITSESLLQPQREGETEMLQAQAAPGQTPAVTPGIESYINSSRGGGEPLSEASRATMEPRFGQDFSGVRVHSDSRAAGAAKSLNAQAFTSGQDIYFGAGQYQPGTAPGQRLMAHELTHVVQHGQVPSQQQIQVVQGMPLLRRTIPNLQLEGEGNRRDVREFIELTIQFWNASREYLRYRTVDRSLLVSMLNSWLRMVNNGWRLIDTRLGGEPALLNRMKTTYRDTVRTLITKASRDLGVTQQQLYRQQNSRIAWWARRDLAAREDIVFIMGSGDRFYRSATQYFNFIGARIISNLRSLLEVRDWLNANRPANGLPWGDISIVVHANLEGQMQIPVAPDESRVTVDSLRQAIQDLSF
ncbi:MAG: DUF4157 domain-containing protein, partial [Chloroflexales bacterium]|nr:DUF4157 domain-containing protein [Chloroflexales bacterium]